MYIALITPFYGDQFVNGAYLKKRGMADTLLYEDLDDANKVYEAIRNLLQPRFAYSFDTVTNYCRTESIIHLEILVTHSGPK